MILTEAAARGWRTARRYAVPAPMIQQATGRRLAGDWRGACSAADVAVDLDLSEINRCFGAGTAKSIEDDLLHFAPDLLRWHLPRRPSTGHTALSPRRLSVLARYGDDGPILAVGSPRTGYGRQQLRLFIAAEPLQTSRPPNAYRGDFDHEPCTWHMVVDPDLPRHVWDARHAGELLTWYGLKPAPHDHLIWGLHDTDRFLRAWAELGVDIPQQRVGINARMALGYWYRLPEIVCAVREAAVTTPGLIVAGWHDRSYLAFTAAGDGRLTMNFYTYTPRDAYVPLERLGLPLDAVLIHLGLFEPDHLHPLVHSALFPAAVDPPAGPPRPGRPSADPVRVRCGGAWHEVRWQDGRVHMPHSEQEEERETTLVALGGNLSGCFAAKTAMQHGNAGLPGQRRNHIDFPDPWAATPSAAVPRPSRPGRPARLPRRLREQRRELMLLALHGDTEGVVSLLDAGVSPHTRDHRGRTLLHFMAHLRDLTLLGRLLADGPDVNGADVAGVTPLAAAAHGMGDIAMIRALIAAGARLDATFEHTGEPINAWLETTRPDVFTAITDLEDHAAITIRLNWRRQLNEQDQPSSRRI